jgi:DNA-binding transcriptional ArsR family regulator
MSDSLMQHPRRGDDRSTSQRERHNAGSTKHREAGDRLPRHARPHPAAAQSHLSELGADVVATRLRTLGHPTRLRLMRLLDRRPAGADELADSLSESVAAVRAHLAVLYRAGIVRRVDDGGRPVYELADWPSMWLVDQLAYRLRLRALEDAGASCGDDHQPSSCR